MPYKDPAAKRAWRASRTTQTRAEKQRYREGGRWAEWADMDRWVVAVRRRVHVPIIARFRLAARQEKLEQGRAWHRATRLEAIALLGGRCARCGADDERVLEFDHKTPLLRRTNGLKSKDNHREIQRVIKHPKSPHDLQLLCGNCHRIKTREGSEWAARFATQSNT